MQSGYTALEPGSGGEAFKETHHIIRRVPDETTRQRHTRDVRLRLWRAPQRVAQSGKELRARIRDRPSLPVDRESVAIEPYFEAITETDEGITCKTLAAFHALQQKAGFERSELHERRDRRIEVARYIEWRFQRLLLRADNKKPIPGVIRRWV